MAEKVQQHDFIEVEFTGRLPDGKVFDTTEKKVAQDNGIFSEKSKYGPMVVCVGEHHILQGLDESFLDKEIGKQYTVSLPPEKAFGKRDVKNMRIIPMSTFQEHKVRPEPGLQVNVDNQHGVVTRVSGGRVIVNFNHPLAGKEVEYDVTIKRKVTDKKEQITTYLQNLLRIPEDAMSVDVKDEKATITFTFDFPEPMQVPLKKKISDIIKIKEVAFVKKE